MASNDVGPAPAIVGAAAEDAVRGDSAVRKPDGSVVEDVKPVAPDQFDEKYETGKYELWAYYSYYIGNNVGWCANATPPAVYASNERCDERSQYTHRASTCSTLLRQHLRTCSASTLLL